MVPSNEAILQLALRVVFAEGGGATCLLVGGSWGVEISLRPLLILFILSSLVCDERLPWNSRIDMRRVGHRSQLSWQRRTRCFQVQENIFISALYLFMSHDSPFFCLYIVIPLSFFVIRFRLMASTILDLVRFFYLLVFIHFFP